MNMKSKRTVLALVAALALLTPGCLIIDHDPDCIGDECDTLPGDIAFYWAFELSNSNVTDSCSLADVARVDVRVFNRWGEVEFSALDRPCGDLGAEITDFFPDDYDLQLVGRCPLGVVTHEAWFTLEVYPGYNDFGELVLDYVGPCY